MTFVSHEPKKIGMLYCIPIFLMNSDVHDYVIDIPYHRGIDTESKYASV
jgi:hypothetical protein